MTESAVGNQYVNLVGLGASMDEKARIELLSASTCMYDILNHREYSPSIPILVDGLQASYRTLCDKRNKWHDFKLHFMFTERRIELGAHTEVYSHLPYQGAGTQDVKESDEELFGCFRTGLVSLLNSNQSNMKEAFEFLCKHTYPAMTRWRFKYSNRYRGVPIFTITAKDIRVFGFETRRYDKPLVIAAA
jgi:hypothetical protein